jgi:nitrate reductase alpha subunit
MAMGHVILREFHLDRQVPYFEDYCRRTPTCRCWCAGRAGRPAGARAAAARVGLRRRLGEDNNPDWKTVAIDEKTGEIVVPNGSIGFRWGEEGKWNLEEKDGGGVDAEAVAGLEGRSTTRWPRRLPLFRQHASNGFRRNRPPRAC